MLPHPSLSDLHTSVNAVDSSTSEAASVSASSGASIHDGHGRGCTPNMTTRASGPLPTAHSSAAGNATAEHSPAETAIPELSRAQLELELTERNGLMFVVGSSAPTASGRRRVLRYASNEAAQIGWQITRERAGRDGRALSDSFGNFDQRVGLGWLLRRRRRKQR